MRGLKLIVLAALALYLIFLALAFIFQRKLLYFPPDIYLTPTAVGVPDMTEIEMRFGDYEGWATGWYASPRETDGKVVMVFHGNGSAVYSNYDIFKDLMNEGYGVWSVGYPGYPGRSPVLAETRQTSLTAAAEGQYEWLLEEGVKPENIVFYGTSLGSGVAAQLSAKHKPALLIMDAPFNSTLDMGRQQLPFLPVRLLMKDQYRSDEALKDLDVPLIWMHGTADSVIPLSQGRKLYEGYNGPKTAHIIKGGQHTNLWGLGGRDIVLEALK